MNYKHTILKFLAIQVAGFISPYVGAVMTTTPPDTLERWDIYLQLAWVPFFAIPSAIPFLLLGLIAIASRIPRGLALACGVVTFGSMVVLHAVVNLQDAQSGIAVLFIPIWVTLLEIAVLVVGLAITVAWRFMQNWRQAPLGPKC